MTKHTPTQLDELTELAERLIEIVSKQRMKIDALVEALEAVYSDIELQNVKGGSDELNMLVQTALAQAKEGVL